MTESKRVTANEVFARKRQEIIDYNASPEGHAAWARTMEKIEREARRQSIVAEGQEASAAGLAVDACPYASDATESRLWVYGFENPLSDDEEEDDDEDSEEVAQ